MLDGGSCGEEIVVEGDDAAAGPVVGVKRCGLDETAVVSKLMLDAVEQPPVTRTPAIDALFHIAYNEVAAVLRHAVAEQYFEIAPLQSAGVLKLVNHDLAEGGTNAFKDKRTVALVNYGIEEPLCVAEQKSVGLIVHISDGLLDSSQQTQFVEVPERELGGAILAVTFASIRLGCFQKVHELCLEQLYDGSAVA